MEDYSNIDRSNVVDLVAGRDGVFALMMAIGEPWDKYGSAWTKADGQNQSLPALHSGMSSCMRTFPSTTGCFCAVPTVEATRFLDQTRESLAPHNVGLELAHPR